MCRESVRVVGAMLFGIVCILVLSQTSTSFNYILNAIDGFPFICIDACTKILGKTVIIWSLKLDANIDINGLLGEIMRTKWAIILYDINNFEMCMMNMTEDISFINPK